MDTIRQLQSQVATLQAAKAAPQTPVTPHTRITGKTASPGSLTPTPKATPTPSSSNPGEAEESDEEMGGGVDEGEGKLMVVSPDGTIASRLKCKLVSC